MTRTAFISEMEYLKECKGTPGTLFEYLGKSTYDKITNILINEKNILTHFYIPKGNAEAVEELKAQHEKLFNTPINEDIISFFTCFDGFEFRYVNLDQAWKAFKEDDLFDWKDYGFDANEVNFSNLQDDEYEIILDEFQSLFNINHISNDNFDFKRLSDPSKTSISFYDDSVEYEDYGIKTFIPPANFFLDNGNKVYGSDTLYNLNFHHSFRQLAYGRNNGKISLFRVDDAGADVKDLREDFRIHLKKNLIRLE